MAALTGVHVLCIQVPLIPQKFSSSEGRRPRGNQLAQVRLENAIKQSKIKMRSWKEES